MANFDPAFEKMIRNEGGYKLINVASDRGGQTYAGIARNYHPNWAGWRYIDANDLTNLQLSDLVGSFYKTEFWDKLSGDAITRQITAESLFDFAVNAGVKTALKLAQITLGTVPDGSLGPVTLGKLNEMEESVFVLKFALAKVARYAEICNKDREQSKFLLGWINRTIRGLA
jgi:lysozyme family protein